MTHVVSAAWLIACAAVGSTAAAAPPWSPPHPPPPYPPQFAPPFDPPAGRTTVSTTLSVTRLPARADAYRIGIRTYERAGWRLRVYPEHGRVVIEAIQHSGTVGPYGRAGGTSRMRQSVAVPRDALPERLSVSETNDGWEVSIPRRTMR